MVRVMTPRIRKAALVQHVVCSVGWLGMVLAFIAMAVMGIAVSYTHLTLPTICSV